MFLIVHLLFGAAVGIIIKNIPLAIAVSFLSHYLFDLVPHIDYPVKPEDRNQWKKVLIAGLKVSLDFFSGILIIFLFSKNQPAVYFCALASVLPDMLTALRYTLPNKLLEIHYQFHGKKIHCWKEAKISNFWRFVIQLALIIVFTALIIKNSY